MKRERLESLIAKCIVQLAACKKREHPIEAYKAIVQLRTPMELYTPVKYSTVT